MPGSQRQFLCGGSCVAGITNGTLSLAVADHFHWPSADVARTTAMTLAVAAAGGALLNLFGLPAAWLSGAMIAVAAYALAGQRAMVPVALREAGFLLIGLAIGAGLSPEMIASVRHWPLSIVILIATVPLLVWAVQTFLVRAMGWQPKEAALAAMPGALSYVLALAASEKVDVARGAIAQTLRLFVIVALVPALVGPAGRGQTGAAQPPLILVSIDSPLLVLLGLGVAALLVGWLMNRWRMPAPLMMSGLLVSGVLHASGILSSHLPALISIPAIIILGAQIGSRFSGMSVAAVRGTALDSLAALGLALIIAFAGAFAVSGLTGVPLTQAFLAFAPGGVDVMVVIAFSLGLDPAYVVAHQLLRFLAIALVLPFVFRWWFPSEKAVLLPEGSS